LTSPVYVVPELEELHPFIIQHDDPSPHCSKMAGTVLDETFPGGWLGRGGPASWPPCLPDVTP
jgi:hypothetical protein